MSCLFSKKGNRENVLNYNASITENILNKNTGEYDEKIDG